MIYDGNLWSGWKIEANYGFFTPLLITLEAVNFALGFYEVYAEHLVLRLAAVPQKVTKRDRVVELNRCSVCEL